jgi:potassium-transporting ATPase KdpC subunit
MNVSVMRPALVLLILLTLVTGILYPLAITGIAQVAFGDRAGGSLIERNGKAVASRLIGQSFRDVKYFWSRPSATAPMAYNAAASGGSNLGPLNPALTDAVKRRIEALRVAHPDQPQDRPVPVDLVTASASGLDPDISVAAALYQVGRVAKARNLPVERVRALVARQSQGRVLRIFGEPRVNVVELNLALDAVAAGAR